MKKYSGDFFVVVEILPELCKTIEEYEKEHQFVYDVINQDKNKSDQLLKRLKEGGFNVSLQQEENTNRWICRCIVELRFNAEDIVWIYERIEEISKMYDGFLEGWSVIKNV